MSDQPQNGQEVELQAGDKKIRIRGSDMLGLINMLCLGIALYGGWSHVEAAKEGQKAVADAIREQAKAQVVMVRAMQEANCLNRLTPEQKKRFEEIQFCKQIGEGR